MRSSVFSITARYAYGPFGEQIHATGPAAQANPWRYATKYLDAETGHRYNHHRPHQSLKYLPPNQYHLQKCNQAA